MLKSFPYTSLFEDVSTCLFTQRASQPTSSHKKKSTHLLIQKAIQPTLTQRAVRLTFSLEEQVDIPLPMNGSSTYSLTQRTSQHISLRFSTRTPLHASKKSHLLKFLSRIASSSCRGRHARYIHHQGTSNPVCPFTCRLAAIIQPIFLSRTCFHAT